MIERNPPNLGNGKERMNIKIEEMFEKKTYPAKLNDRLREKRELTNTNNTLARVVKYFNHQVDSLNREINANRKRITQLQTEIKDIVHNELRGKTDGE